ncbi:hypothetical protein GCM10020366_02450 [Saccharopolyspora gregorii]|uniref:LGFP repeat-containing protein n=1 Tax=Saccharopolyspora gregorii TaxID=33914 RepID=A0ABP6RIK1_9PSEU
MFHTEATGVTEIHGDIAARYNDIGGYDVLGAADADERVAPDGVGRYTSSRAATRPGPPRSTGPTRPGRRACGADPDFWEAKGWEVGYLGYPTKTTTATVDGSGSYNHFVGPNGDGASVYWSEETDAHSVQGAIREAWAAQGWETGELGYPTTDEQVADDDIGRFNEFSGRQETGAVYWSRNPGRTGCGATCCGTGTTWTATPATSATPRRTRTRSTAASRWTSRAATSCATRTRRDQRRTVVIR